MTETVTYEDGVTCEVRKPLAKKKRQRLNPGTHRMYIPEYHRRLEDAKTVGDVVSAMRRIVSSMAGGHSYLEPELWEKIRKACECREPV